MIEITALSRERIADYLNANDIPFEVDEDGDFVLEYEPDEETGWQLTIFLITEGDAGEIFTLRGMIQPDVPREQWNEALQVCNEWNGTTSWTKSYLGPSGSEEEEGDGEPEGRALVVERQVDLEMGIHQAFFEHLTAQTLDAFYGFTEWGPEQISLPVGTE